ncbi:Uncharacterised protein [Myroides odoratus]|nr:hypothetical protein HMPREF9716_02181 [Myroides odoratus CIP 103059]STZ30415.1 Uncharacterised protein [Myroides odoratus]
MNILLLHLKKHSFSALSTTLKNLDSLYYL